MAGLLLRLGRKDVDARDKRGHDGAKHDSIPAEPALAPMAPDIYDDR